MSKFEKLKMAYPDLISFNTRWATPEETIELDKMEKLPINAKIDLSKGKRYIIKDELTDEEIEAKIMLEQFEVINKTKKKINKIYIMIVIIIIMILISVVNINIYI